MTAVATLRSRPARGRRPSAVAGLLLGAALAAAVATLAGARLGTGSGSDTPARRAEVDRAAIAADRDLAAYAAALEPLAVQGGQIVAEGLRPGVADIAQGAYPDDVLVRMASGWLASMRDVRAAVADLLVAPGATAVSVKVERALAAYVSTAEALLDAARATGQERALLVELATGRGRAADRLYDEATAELAGLTHPLLTLTRPERP